MTPTKTCLHCGHPIQGRPDKKFCDDHCRSYFNNHYNHDVSSTMRNINYILRKNRRLLIAFLNDSSRIRINKDSLTSSGFDFRYFTHIYQNAKGQHYRLCYDYGYLTDPSGQVTIVAFQQTNGLQSSNSKRRFVNTPGVSNSQLAADFHNEKTLLISNPTVNT